MSAFLSDLCTQMSRPTDSRNGRNRYTLIAPLHYQSDLVGSIVVPVGFVTDFASIPRACWRYIDPEDACIAYASVVHDYIYTAQPTSRGVADKVLDEAMGVSGARWDQRKVVYAAVRLFGGSHWNNL